MMGGAVLDQLKAASKELREVDIGYAVQRVHISQLGGPLCFATQFLAKNKPVIIEGALDAWPAMRKWDAEYMTKTAGASKVTVDLTPNGRGDAVTNIDLMQHQHGQKMKEACNVAEIDGKQQQGGEEGDRQLILEKGVQGQGSTKCFVTPCKVQMQIGHFFQLLRATRQPGSGIVPYVQHQNNSLSEEFGFLLEDTQPNLDWVDKVFLRPPEATNLWIGDERSVTTFHKDHYENMYAVIRGTKVFHLLPPSDLYRMYLRRYPAAQWECGAAPQFCCDSAPEPQDLGQQLTPLQPKLLEPHSHVFWTEVDPCPEDPLQACKDFPLFHEKDLPRPLVAEVGPGDLLYLPACWYHRVSQLCTQSPQGHDYVCAVNFWYDMAFSHSPWVHMQLVEGLSELLGIKDKAK